MFAGENWGEWECGRSTGLMLANEAEWSFVSPTNSPNSLNYVEVPVIGKNGRFVLLGLGGYPNIMPRNGCAIGFQLAPDVCVDSGRCGIQGENNEAPLQLLQLCFISNPFPRGQEPEPIFAEHNWRKEQICRLGQ